MSKSKQLKRQACQIELLKNFEGDFYQEKKIGDKWYVKMWNGATKKWQVAVYGENSFRNYKKFTEAQEYEDELQEKFRNL